MRPHPRIRKTVKWGGAVVTVLLAAVWIGSAWWSLTYWRLRAHANTKLFEVEGGLVRAEFAAGTLDPEDFDAVTEWRLWRYRDRMRWWWPRVHGTRYGRLRTEYSLCVPLWAPASISAIALITATAFDMAARRRARLNLCPNCGYDRTGRAASAKCPECGAAPAAR
jgi:hypothetical protein